ncbi:MULTISPECIES: hypothetical protein [Pseudomonas]|uniref:hypothetical protein n=1 Tax=Pseudomonas TaxID=286 RepID=UPI001F3B1F85|nr:hypothetical protein [Pseudomonas fragi]MCF6763396.1 hypothetical protein [Pseudomonas fragi]
MIKFWSAVYVFATSIAYFYLVTNANKLYEEKTIALPVLCAIVVFLAFLISFFKDKISEVEWNDKLKVKDADIARLEAKVSEKEGVIHALKSTFVSNVLSANEQTPEEFMVVQRALAMRINADPIINNISPAAPVIDITLSSYLDIRKTSKHAS